MFSTLTVVTNLRPPLRVLTSGGLAFTRYREERLGAGRGLFGWLRTALVVRQVFNRLVREHMEGGRRIAEKRAARSHLHRRGGAGGS